MANPLLRRVSSLVIRPLSFRLFFRRRESVFTLLRPLSQLHQNPQNSRLVGFCWQRRSFSFSHGSVSLVISGQGKPKFQINEMEPPKKEKWKTKKRLKLQRKRAKQKRKAGNKRDPRKLGVKGKKKKRQRFANAEERTKYKLENALEKSKYEQSLESLRCFIAIAEKELELYYRNVALYGDSNDRDSKSIFDNSRTMAGPNEEVRLMNNTISSITSESSEGLSVAANGYVVEEVSEYEDERICSGDSGYEADDMFTEDLVSSSDEKYR